MVVAITVAAAPKCEGRADLVDACFVVRGRVSAYNGNPTFRMWIVGTQRLLGIDQDVDERPAAPRELAPYLNFDHDVFGDFRVCPLTPEREGWMRRVCIESASNWFAKKKR